MNWNPTRDVEPGAARAMLWAIGAAALLFGLYGRFKGIGTWPLGVDEFYISRSIDNVLRSGLPAFNCGGYYTRGLLYQYGVAALRLLGWTPEFAGRWVAAVASLALLPAIYLLGRRVQSSLLGWLVAVTLCVSIWEIEMARFARMYAPFQAVFAWYVLAYLRFVTTQHAAALRWMIALSVVGVLTWEGGVLLGISNLFAVLIVIDGKPKARDWLRVAGLCVLLVLLYAATRDLRGFTDPPASAADAMRVASTPLQMLTVWLAPLGSRPVWTLGLLLPLACCVPALRWIASLRARWLVVAGLALVLVAAAVHAFLIAAGILVLLLLSRLLERQTLTASRARFFWLALAGFLIFWSIVALASGGLTPHARLDSPPQSGDLEIVRRLAGLPDILDHVLRPWLRTLPGLSVGLLVCFVYLCMRCIGGRETRSVAMLLCLVIVLALVVGATPTDRIETRYTFFLYPIVALLGIYALLALAQRALSRRWAVFAAAVPLLCFAATEDFQPRQVLNIDSAAVNYRVGMSAHRVEHYYPRNDIRGVADWLAAQVQPGDLVITGIPSLDQYDHHVDYFFLDETDARYEAYVCADNRTERWTNLPVLYGVGAIQPLLDQHHRIYASVFAAAEQRLKEHAAAAGWSVSRVWRAPSGTADVILIAKAKAP